MLKPVAGFEQYYAVDELGNVFSYRKNRYLTPKIDKYGYRVVTLSGGGKIKTVGVHRLVAKAFVENPSDKPCVNHIDEDKLNNSKDNLEWVTVKENDNHGSRNQRMALTKSKHPVEMLKEDGSTIRYAGVKEAFRQTGITRSQISLACRNKGKKAGGYEWRFANE